MKQIPKGLTKYHRNSDTLSACLGKYMTQNGLRLSKEHTVYSIRHTFQDMLRIHKADERIQAELMGHSYNLRAKYGEPSLQEKYDVISQFAFDVRL